MAFSKDNTTVVLGVGKNRLFSNVGFLAFTGTDCTGSAFFTGLSGFLTSALPNTIRNGAVYVPDANAPPPFLPMTFKSGFSEFSEPQRVTIEFEVTEAVQAKILGNLPAFTPPFSVR